MIDRVVDTGVRSVALLGLSFKMLSDDLRESPYVVLAEALIGKGFDLRIYDPIVEPSKLIGTNLNYVTSKLPHLKRILSHDPETALAAADLALVGTSDPATLDALCAARPKFVIDLNGRLGDRVESLPGYEGFPGIAPSPNVPTPMLKDLRRFRGPPVPGGDSERGRPSVLIIVQNLPVPFDRRVWLECQTLVAAGYAVSVVCPKGPDDPGEETIDGVNLYKYRPPTLGNGALAFVYEYLYSFIQTSRLVRKAWRRRPSTSSKHVTHRISFGLLLWPFETRGVRFVFDHHDLCPSFTNPDSPTDPEFCTGASDCSNGPRTEVPITLYQPMTLIEVLPLVVGANEYKR